MERLNSVEELKTLRESLIGARDDKKSVVRVCMGPGCLAQGADRVADAFRESIKAKGLEAEVEPLIKETGCHGFCKQGPLVNLDPSGLFYASVKPADVEEIVESHLIKGEVVERLLYSENGTQYKTADEIPFYKMQTKIAMRNPGRHRPVEHRGRPGQRRVRGPGQGPEFHDSG